MNCKEKSIECLDDSGLSTIVEGMKMSLELRQILAIHIIKAKMKGCMIYIAYVKDLDTPPSSNGFPNLQEFQDVFLDEWPKLPPK